MRLTRRTILATPLALAACAAEAPARTVLREANDHVVTSVSLGGRETLALIDNGAPLTSLDQGFAAAAGLARSTVGSGLQPLDMRVGEAPLRIHPFVEDMAEAAIATDAPVGVIAGMELFDAFAVELAFSRGEILLHRRGAYRPTQAALALRTDQGALPHPRLDLVVEGVPVSAFVDLGCSAALAVSQALAARLPLGDGRLVSTRQVILSDAQGLGLGASRLTSVKAVRFAGRDFRDVPVDVLPGDAKAFAGLDAVVGVPLLRKFDVAFDLPRRIVLAPNGRIAEPFERRMTGLQTKPDGAALLVRHVAAGSPGEKAGFAPGDVITAIDDAPPLMRTLRNVRLGQTVDIRLAGGSVRRLTGARYY
jgi:predicted aspartyl protease